MQTVSNVLESSRTNSEMFQNIVKTSGMFSNVLECPRTVSKVMEISTALSTSRNVPEEVKKGHDVWGGVGSMVKIMGLQGVQSWGH